MENKKTENISSEEQKKIMLNILIQFSNFCEKNKLQYFMDSGTLLGAVRHHGFIPWDDDIDVCMPRPDYNRFLQLLKSQDDYICSNIHLVREIDSPYFYVKIVDTRTVLIEYPDTFPIETCVYIDVFPKDGIKNKTITDKLICKIVHIYNLTYWLEKFTIYKWMQHGNFIQKIIALIVKILARNPEKCFYMASKIAQKNNYNKCNYLTSIVCSGLVGCVHKQCFNEYIMLDFEGHKFHAPIGYDEYLKTLYNGDYMILPPIQDRKGHEIIAYWKEV